MGRGTSTFWGIGKAEEGRLIWAGFTNMRHLHAEVHECTWHLLLPRLVEK